MEDPDTLMSKADKKASGRSGFAFWSGSNNYEDAVDLYTQAGNAYRLKKQAHKAGEAFERAAKVQMKTDEKDFVPNTLVEAFKCYKQDYPQDAARVLQEAIQLFVSKGNLRRGANYMSDLGNIYETQLNDLPHAIDAYEESADWYLSDQAEALSKKAVVKAAELSALAEQYPRAIKHFEAAATASINNPLTRFATKEHFLRAGICYLADGDTVATRQAMLRYCDLDPTFSGTREQKFLEDMLGAFEQGDQEAFSDVVFQYDQLSRLDQWKSSLLLKVKNRISDEPDLT